MSGRRAIVPGPGLAMRSEEWSTLFCLFYGLCGKFVYFRRYSLKMEDLPPHKTIDDPVRRLLRGVSFMWANTTYPLAMKVIKIPPTVMETFRIFVAGKHSQMSKMKLR